MIVWFKQLNLIVDIKQTGTSKRCLDEEIKGSNIIQFEIIERCTISSKKHFSWTIDINFETLPDL